MFCPIKFVVELVRSAARSTILPVIAFLLGVVSAEAQSLTAAQERALKPKDIFKECADCPEMVVVPAGQFIMGSPATEAGRNSNEGPRHRVTIARPFAVSKFPVTSKEWRACARQRGCRDDADDGLGDHDPVTGPSWNDAQSFLTWLSKFTGKTYRLLSEAEYEYTARAGTQTAYPWGDKIGVGNANCYVCGSKWDNNGPSPAGSFAPNRFGLHDMVGNVQSFVEDCYHEDYRRAPTNGSAWTTGDCQSRVVRGGSFALNGLDLRSAARQLHGTVDRYPDLGFRVARTLNR